MNVMPSTNNITFTCLDLNAISNLLIHISNVHEKKYAEGQKNVIRFKDVYERKGIKSLQETVIF